MTIRQKEKTYTITASKRGFTIVELLVVIVIITILATVTVVAFNGLQNRAVVATLQSDLQKAATQLNLVRAENKTYPVGPTVPIFLKASSGTNYQYDSDGNTYCLTATSSRLGIAAYNISSTGSVSEGACTGHIAGPIEPIACPDGFIVVPGNVTYGTTDFCVMKYEAKNVGGVPASQPGGLPWTSISQSASITASQNACDGCQLITEAQWMTIATNVISVDSNWSGGSVGSGYLFNGHVNNYPAAALAASPDDNLGMFGMTGGTGSGSNFNNRRTLTLTNGEVIWDLAGNVSEWTQGTISTGQPGLSGETAFSIKDYDNPGILWNSLPMTSRPTEAARYSRAQGVGGLLSNPASTTTYIFTRSASWNATINAGVLTLFINSGNTGGNASFGFRVTK